MSGAFTLKRGEGGRYDLVFDLPGEKVNKFNTPVMAELEALLGRELLDSSIKLLVVRSGKPGIFIAGADIDELAAIKSEAEGQEKSRRGQAIFNRLEALPYPTLALIDGACLGGGMELALSCTARVVTDNPKVKLGLPEVQLGILPGWGGTQRLPRLIGLPDALDLILNSRQLDGKKAVKLGLADKLVSQEFQDEQLEIFIRDWIDGQGQFRHYRRKKVPLLKAALGLPLLRLVTLNKARKAVLGKTLGNYPAPLAVLDVLRRSMGKSLDAGLAIEAEGFSHLAVTAVCRNLIGLYHGTEKLKRFRAWDATVVPGPVRQVGVLGAGVMGGGIAWLFSQKDRTVRLKDINWDAVGKGMAQAARYFGEMATRKKLTPSEFSMAMHRISGTLDYKGFDHLDVVVEAVIEDMGIKKKVLAELEPNLRPDAVICSNTSALSISEMATALKQPERMVGMHFFNPVNRMPLVEVIRGERTSDAVVATVVALTRELGKHAVVVKDRPGFLVNRILIPYMNEAALLLQEGCDMRKVDAAVERFGMPMGPFRLADEVGVDVGLKVVRHLEESFSDRLKAAPLLAKVVEKKWLGKKTKAGFYLHAGKSSKPNPELLAMVRADFPLPADGGPSDVDALDRLVLSMVREASLCFEEGITDGPDLLDLAMIYGTGFPPFRGGVLRHADDSGIGNIVTRLKSLADRYGQRFAPTPLLEDMARAGRKFYDSMK